MPLLLILCGLNPFLSVYEGQSCRFCWVYEGRPEIKQAEPKKSEPTGRLLLYFGATWCGPCRQQKQVFDRMRRAGRPWDIGPDNDGHIRTLDYDRDREMVRKYRVTAVPTWVLIENGRVLRSKTGEMTSYQILDFWENER